MLLSILAAPLFPLDTFLDKVRLLILSTFKSSEETRVIISSSIVLSSFLSPSISFILGGFEYLDIPIRPTTKVRHAPQAPNSERTCSSKTPMPQKNDVRTMIGDHVPTAIANPAARIP